MVRLARKSLWTRGQGAGGLGWAEVHRIAGEIALMSPEPDAAKGEAYLERALAVARKQQARSLGTARSNGHGAALARPREDTASSRTARSGLWMVHRRVRHARSERGPGVLNALSPPPD